MSQVVSKSFLDQVIIPAHAVVVSTLIMTDPDDLTKTMDSLHLDPEVAKKKIADLEERNALLEARDTKRGKEIKILREMDYHQRDKINELEAELDASKCTEEEYRVEVDRLERHVDVDLLEENEKHIRTITELNKQLLKAQGEVRAKDIDIQMRDTYEDLRLVCRHWAAGGCRHGGEVQVRQASREHR